VAELHGRASSFYKSIQKISFSMNQSTSNVEYLEKDNSFLRKSLSIRVPKILENQTKGVASVISLALLVAVGLLTAYKFTDDQRALLPVYASILVQKDGKNRFNISSKSQPLVSERFLRETIQSHLLVSGEEAFQVFRLIANRELLTFNSNLDLLIFDHPMKTGGTSISDALKDVFPREIFSGSDRSGYFNYQNTRSSMEVAANNRTLAQWLNRQKIIYSHTSFYDKQGRPTKFSLFLQSTFPKSRRFRTLTMVRIIIFRFSTMSYTA
jgi:hypothetical protein